MSARLSRISRSFAFAAVIGAVVLIAAPSASAASSQDADVQAINNFALNDHVIAQCTVAARNLVALRKQHPDLAKQMDKDSDEADSKTLAQAAAVIDKHPEAHAAITESGMSVTDYLKCTLALIQTGFRDAALREGASPSAVPAGIATDNVHYYRANKARLDALGKMIGQLTSDSDE